MKRYIATFHTHLAAMRTERMLTQRSVPAKLAPVPRTLSASCGTCVRYASDAPMLECMDRDYERIVELTAPDAYRTLFENE